MAIIKEFREFYLRHTQVNSGAKADQEGGFVLQYLVDGVLKYNRFLKGDFPSEAVMEKFLESIPFTLNPEDTAIETEQGIVKLATDIEAYSRTDTFADSMSRVIVPGQVPQLSRADLGVGLFDMTIVEGTSSIGGRTVKTWTINQTNQNYCYVASCTDGAGTGFTLTPNPAHDWLGFLQSSIPIVVPVAGDFAGLWFNYGIPANGAWVNITGNATPPGDGQFGTNWAIASGGYAKYRQLAHDMVELRVFIAKGLNTAEQCLKLPAAFAPADDIVKTTGWDQGGIGAYPDSYEARLDTSGYLEIARGLAPQNFDYYVQMVYTTT